MNQAATQPEQIAASWSEARRVAAEFYYTGNPCKHGHDSVRRSSNGRCVSCDRQYYQDHKTKIMRRSADRHANNRDDILAKRRQKRADNPESARAEMRAYYAANKERMLESNRRYVERNKEKVSAKRAEWVEKNAEHVAEMNRNYMRERNQSDAMFNLRNRCRSRINKALRRKSGRKARHTTESIIGCSLEYLYYHIESQFTDGMTWDNRSQWHVDHIIPLASAETEDEVLNLCHYTNLQPLWAADNIRKSNHIQTLGALS